MTNIFIPFSLILIFKRLTALLAEDISEKSQNTPKTVVLCTRIQDTALLYMSLKALRKHFTYPVGYPNLQQFQIVDMYTRACTVKFKESVLKLFTTADEVIIATTAIGMGIDCPDIERIIHWGATRESWKGWTTIQSYTVVW